MIDKDRAVAIASEQLKSAGFENQYNFDSCTFFNERTGRYPSVAKWVVRYMKPPAPDGSVTDDGDELFVVTIEAESGAVHVFCGL